MQQVNALAQQLQQQMMFASYGSKNTAGMPIPMAMFPHMTQPMPTTVAISDDDSVDSVEVPESLRNKHGKKKE